MYLVTKLSYVTKLPDLTVVVPFFRKCFFFFNFENILKRKRFLVGWIRNK
jgi:hypothetical protein